MRFKFFLLIAAAISAVGITATAAFAESPTSIDQSGGLHFVGTPDVSLAGNATAGFYLVGTGEVAGAGQTATGTLSATANLTTGCINRGSKDQQPSGLQRTSTPTGASATVNTRAGRASFTLESSPKISGSSRTCPDDMRAVIVSLTFTNITLTVTSQTGTTTAHFADITAV
jgi:hypothetical protein